MSVTGKVPIRDPLGLRNDIITNPQWVKWLTEQLAPAIVAIDQAGGGPETLLLYRQATGVSQAQDAAESAMVAAGSRRPVVAESFPPQMRISPPIYSQPDLLPGFPFARPDLPWVLADTHANRANYPNGAYLVDTLFVETDRLVVFRNTGTAWKYVDGTYTATLSSIPTLGTDDAGFLFGVSDYGHLLRWSGTAWGWAPGDAGSGMMALFEIDPGAGWHIYDGTANVPYLKSDGTTGTVTLPDLTSAGALAAFLEGGSPNSGPTAAVAPTFTGSSANTSADSAGTPAGSVSAPIFTGNPVAAASTNATPDLVAPDVTATGVSPVTTATGTNSAPTFTGSALGAHQHTVTATGTVSATGEPRKIIRRPFFRQ